MFAVLDRTPAEFEPVADDSACKLHSQACWPCCARHWYIQGLAGRARTCRAPVGLLVVQMELA